MVDCDRNEAEIMDGYITDHAHAKQTWTIAPLSTQHGHMDGRHNYRLFS